MIYPLGRQRVNTPSMQDRTLCQCNCHNGTGLRPAHEMSHAWCTVCREERDAWMSLPFADTLLLP